MANEMSQFASLSHDLAVRARRGEEQLGTGTEPRFVPPQRVPKREMVGPFTDEMSFGVNISALEKL